MLDLRKAEEEAISLLRQINEEPGLMEAVVAEVVAEIAGLAELKSRVVALRGEAARLAAE